MQECAVAPQGPRVRPVRNWGPASREEGRRVERVPEFNANDLIEAFTAR